MDTGGYLRIKLCCYADTEISNFVNKYLRENEKDHEIK